MTPSFLTRAEAAAGKRHLGLDAQRIINISTGGRGERRPKHIVFNFGHHDLRDISAARYLADWTLFTAELVVGLKRAGYFDRGGRLIWRMAPAYSYRRDLSAKHEYRTNQKIAWANARIAEYVELLARSRNVTIEVHDSFAVTAPFFTSTVDTHYLSAFPDERRGAKRTGLGRHGHGHVGLADLNALLNTICNA